MTDTSLRGKLIIVSGPSASGKTTLLERLFALCPGPMVMSVSATTRSPRAGEVDGVHYHFLTPEAFSAARARGEFLECFEVHGRGTWYGTLEREVTTGLIAGKWVILEIDVQGTLRVLERYPGALTIFVHPGSLEELERRLRRRGTESEADIQRRLASARRELAQIHHYRYHVVNDDLDRAVQEICDLLQGSGGASA